jgi:N-acylneuraminate cytidylyltransferase
VHFFSTGKNAMTNICVIPARGGSRRIPKKNIKLFHGKPIIAYSIETAKASGLFDEIYVSTDDVEIANVAAQYGAKIHKRPEELARDEVGTQEVGRAFYDWLDNNRINEMCLIYATAPMLRVEDLRGSYRHLLRGDRCGFVFSVGANPLRDAGMFYWGEAFLWSHECYELIDFNSSMWPIPENRICDINTPEDWERAERMYEELHK